MYSRVKSSISHHSGNHEINNKKYPYEIKPVEDSINQELKKHFRGQKDGFVQVGPKKWFYPKKFNEHAEKYYNFKIKKDDLWIISFPRSGTTWLQEILWLINNDLDYETDAKIYLDNRFPFFEFNMLLNDKLIEELKELNKNDPLALKVIKQRDTPGYIIGETLKSPRHFKTHLPPSLLPPNLIDTCKVVFIARNPLDAAVSFYHHNKTFRTHDYEGDFEKYWDFFEKGLISFSPYWEHIKECWQYRNHHNCLFLFYEDLVRDLSTNLKKIGNFLNKNMTDDDIEKLSKHLHIDNFKTLETVKKEVKLIGSVNPGGSGAIRTGKIGGNKEFDENLRLRAEKWFKENLSQTDVKFPEF